MKVKYEQCFDKLVKGKVLSEKNYEQLVKEFRQPLARDTFVVILKSHGSLIKFGSFESLQMLSNLILRFLDEVEKESMPNYKSLETILHISRKFTVDVSSILILRMMQHKSIYSLY